jgi:hypothetical protein
MAGATAVAPKQPGQRRRYNQPARGEWVDLPPLQEPVLPAYPPEWTGEQVIPRYVWDLWRQDPVTSQWTPADIATVLEMGQRYYTLADSERRIVQTSLGLNPRGRRDLRWRTQLEASQQVEANAKTAQLRRLRLVAERHAKTEEQDAGEHRV